MSLVTCENLRDELRQFANETFKAELSQLVVNVQKELRLEMRTFLQEMAAKSGIGSSHDSSGPAVFGPCLSASSQGRGKSTGGLVPEGDGSRRHAVVKGKDRE